MQLELYNRISIIAQSAEKFNWYRQIRLQKSTGNMENPKYIQNAAGNYSSSGKETSQSPETYFSVVLNSPYRVQSAS